MELGSPRIGNNSRIRSLFERALETKATQQSVVLWRTYLAYEFHINKNMEGARRVYFRAIHACPWYELLQLLCIRLSFLLVNFNFCSRSGRDFDHIYSSVDNSYV